MILFIKPRDGSTLFSGCIQFPVGPAISLSSVVVTSPKLTLMATLINLERLSLLYIIIEGRTLPNSQDHFRVNIMGY